VPYDAESSHARTLRLLGIGTPVATTLPPPLPITHPPLVPPSPPPLPVPTTNPATPAPVETGVLAGFTSCPTCESTYLTEAAYIAHLQESHQDAPDLSVYQADIPARLARCPYCRRICKGSRGLALHRRRCPSRPQQADTTSPTASPLPASPDLPSPRDLANSVTLELLPLFGRGLFSPHRAWRHHLNRISSRLVTTICSSNDAASELATACLQLLPGLVVAGHSTHKLPVSTMLKALANAVDCVPDDTIFAQRIVAYATELAPYVAAQIERSQERSTSGNQRSVTSLTHSIERLVRERRLGSAMVLLDKLQPLLSEHPESPLPPPPSHEQVVSIVAGLHPPAGPEDTFTEEDYDRIHESTPIVITSGDIPLLLDSLPEGSAAGVSGWTYSAIKAIYPSDNASSCEQLAKLLTRMLEGRLTSTIWLQSRCVLIPKASGGYRPLGIGDAWYRLAARAALQQLGPGIGQQLSPLQNGIGVSSGCEIGGRIGQLIMTAPSSLNLIVTSTDFKNGFNLPGRRRLLQALQRVAPGLLRWFQWTHGQPSPLIQNGVCVGWSATGCRQGDPLSSLIFCAYIHPVLERMQSEIRAIVEADIIIGTDALPPISGIYAYIDDVSFYYNGIYSSRVEATIRSICDDEGILLNLSKCYHLVRETSVLDTTRPHLFTVTTTGERILGAPAGSSEFRRDYVARKVDSALSSIPALTSLQPWTSWHLLRSCISARLGYLARVLEPSDTSEAFTHFDQCIDDAVATIAQVNRTEEKFLLRWLRCLPLDLNGLGLPRYHGLAGDTACLLSRETTYNFLETHHPELIVSVTDLWQPITLGAPEEALFLVPAREARGVHRHSLASAANEEAMERSLALSPDEDDVSFHDPHFSSSLDPMIDAAALLDVPSLLLASGERWVSSIAWDPTAPAEERRIGRTLGRSDPHGPHQRQPRARPIRRALYQRLSLDLIHHLHYTGRRPQARWMRASCFKGSGRWLQGPGGAHFYGRLAFRTSHEYRAALRMRLLLSPASSDVGDASGVVLCSCGQQFDPADQPFHALDCSDSQWHFIQRHNLVRNILCEFIQKHVIHRVELEPSVGRRNGTEITTEDNIAEADARQVERRRAGRLRSRQQRPVTQSVSAFAADRTRQLREGHFRADIGILSPTKRVIIDVAVGNPAAASYINPPSGYRPPAAHNADPIGRNYALEHREEEKLLRYRSLLGAAADDPTTFVPFAMTTTGCISNRATRFLRDEVLRDSNSSSTRACTELNTKLSVAVVRYNAMAVLAWVRRLITARTQM